VFLALRELWFARARFLLMGAVVGLISVLMVILSGLASGLVNDGVSGLQRTPVQSFAFAEGTKADAAFTRSVVTFDQVKAWQQRDDVAHAEPFGVALVNTRNEDETPVDLTLVGLEDGSALAPKASEGRDPSAPGEVVASATLADEGVEVGDVLTLDRLGTELTVVGLTDDQRTFGHVDMAYVDLRTWQGVQTGTPVGEEPPAHAHTQASAVAVQGEDGALPDLAAGDEAAGTESMTLEESYDASPGYKAEMMTMEMIKVFLYAISALVVGAFLSIWTVQRTKELAVLRAMGASGGYLLRDSLLQALVVLVASVGAGVAVGLGLGSLLTGSGMPFALEAGPITQGAVLLVVLGLLGAGFAIVRVLRVDPLTALGDNR